MATIGKFKGRWQARVRLKGHSTQCKTFRSRRDALGWAQDTEAALRRATPSAEQARRLAGALSLRVLLDRYEQEVTPRKRSAERERYMMRNLRAEPELVDKPIGEVTASDISSWRIRRLENVAEGTALREWSLLQHLFEVARRDWGIDVQNPLKLARRPKPALARERRLKEKEEAQLLAACRKAYVSWLEPLVCLAIDTAMRQGELLSLTWENIDLDDGYAYIPADQTKTSKARTVPLSPRNRRMLKQMVSAVSNGKKRTASQGRLFPVTRNALRLAWTRTLERAGITGLRFHDLRHEATSRFFEMGLDTMEVAAITGHETLQMLKRYTHLQTRQLVRKLRWPAAPEVTAKRKPRRVGAKHA
ncbi:MAG: site-specific integrase [Acidiferrobacterales bacterium]